ncbi:hypoxanthine phosphoribosyltransferase [Enorma phocaeensis]|uniref:hypoxanthine phosphoribosyltransferase n=1 Tax=Enorma phocaeensis TaxID=1871019 RepID=UPI000C830DC2|nr:hypoxanthine phosphoribosyltransferase [Enorma phocaeensis]
MSETSMQHPDVESVLFDEETIASIVKRMGEEITRDYHDRDLVLIAVLRGAVVFMGDLMRAIDVPLAIDFMAVSSYGDKAKSSGVVRIVKDLDMDIKGRDVLIVEDILDSGLTLKYLMKNLSSRKPASIEVATFLWKDIEGKQAAINPKYVGTHCPDAFVVGYGLDFAERYRNLPYVGILKPEVYS